MAESSGSPKPERAHKFRVTTFKKPTWCAYCDTFIWGLVRQGYSCREDGYPLCKKCHRKELSNLPNNCGSWKRRHHDEMEFDDGTIPHAPTFESIQSDIGLLQVSGRLLVEIKSASNCAPKDSNGLSDPYVIGWLEDEDGNPIGKQFKTKVRRRTLNPEWGFQTKIWLRRFAVQRLQLTVYDHDVVSADDFMGLTSVSLTGEEGVAALAGTITKPLLPRGQEVVSGDITVLLRWVADEYEFSCPRVVYNDTEIDLEKRVPRWPPNFPPDTAARSILMRMGQHISTWTMAGEKAPNRRLKISEFSFGEDASDPDHGTATLLVCKRPRHEFVLHAHRRRIKELPPL
eukprot:CAMPEP_0174240838 /NCGR_PEP_ID=MMETSP0417-20130205/20792_1 /TAXON_ID=242541 /ORGANISM="Mayorella sp, Strain BSH-02190019" /LENGTH=343 /DNA_ID=CAMNT_0015319999 /DNA_START=76 /DNA_END=1107 /DNA_ORIENTATION=+